MYAANLHDQLINAAFPLKPLTTWAGGACTVTVAVPPTQSTAGVSVESVSVELLLPSGQSASADAVNVPNSPNWVATFAAELFATSGFVENGLTVRLGGTDERSASRVWIVSKGDLEVKPGDASPSPSGSYVVVKLRDAAPEDPVEGDAYISGGTLYVYDGSAWQTIGGGGGSDDSKLDGAAAYPAWDASRADYLDGEVVSWHGKLWKADEDILEQVGPPDGEGAAYWDETTLDALKQDALSSAQLAAVNSGATAAKVATWDGYAAQIAQKANTTDLPYRMVEPGKWEFSGSGYDPSKSYSISEDEISGIWYYDLEVDGDFPDQVTSQTKLDVVNFPSVSLTATRNVLLDRAGNRVVVTGDTTLTLPAANPGCLRDFLVRLEISGSTVPTITFAAPTGETIVYETDGDEFPVPDEAGTWSYSFTESCVAHKFAVSLKKVNEVAAPQAQGGS